MMLSGSGDLKWRKLYDLGDDEQFSHIAESAGGTVPACNLIYGIDAQVNNPNGSVTVVDFSAESTAAPLVDANGTSESINASEALVCPATSGATNCSE